MVVLRRMVPQVLVAALLLAACSGNGEPTIQSIGMDVRADVQQGTTFQLVVPQDPDVRLEVSQTPPEVAAGFSPAVDDGILFTVEVGPTAPVGLQKIDIQATVDGEAWLLNWDFTVEPAP